jgi:hypothetical protein
MEGGVAFGTSASFEFAEYLLPEPLPLIVRMDTHVHDFGMRVQRRMPRLLSRRCFVVAYQEVDRPQVVGKSRPTRIVPTQVEKQSERLDKHSSRRV